METRQHKYDLLSDLEDLKKVLGASNGSLVDKIIFDFKTIIGEFDDLNSHIDRYSNIEDVLVNKVSREIEKYLLKDNSNVKQVNFFKESLTNINLEKWNDLLSTIPLLLKVSSQFNFVGNMSCLFFSDRFVLRGRSYHDNWSENFKEVIYSVTRLLLKKRYLLTYELVEEDEESFVVELKLSYGEEDGKLLLFEKEELPLKFAISSKLKDFIIENDQAKFLGRHLVIYLDENFLFKRKVDKVTNVIQENWKGEKASKEIRILHFPFLFRPVSLIIPSKEKVIFFKDQKSIINLDHDDTEELSKVNEDTVIYLDIFSYMSR